MTLIAGVYSAILCRPRANTPYFATFATTRALNTKEVLGPRFDDLGPDVRGDFLQEFSNLAERHNPDRASRRAANAPDARRARPSQAHRRHHAPACGRRLAAGIVHRRRCLVMSIAFNAAYEAAEAFSRLYAARCPGAGFLKTILLRRIGSSAQAGLETARHILERIDVSLLPEDEVGDEGLPADDAPPDPQEIELLRDVERNLAAVVGGTGDRPEGRGDFALSARAELAGAQWRDHLQPISNHSGMGARSPLCSVPGRAGRALCRRCGLVRSARNRPALGRARADQGVHPTGRYSAGVRNRCSM